MNRNILTIVLAANICGCATFQPFGPLPKEEAEFHKPKEQLLQEYPEIGKYEEVWRGFSPNFPMEDSLVDNFGPPDRQRRDWLNPVLSVAVLAAINADPVVWAIVIAARPDTPKYYYYDKGDYCIEVYMDKTSISGYKRYATSWKWEQDKTKCVISDSAINSRDPSK